MLLSGKVNRACCWVDCSLHQLNTEAYDSLFFNAKSPAPCGLSPIKENYTGAIYRKIYPTCAKILFGQIKRVLL